MRPEPGVRVAGRTPTTPGHWREGQVLVGLIVLAVTVPWSLKVISFLDVKNLFLWLGNIALWSWHTYRGVPVGRGFQAMAPCWITWAVVAGIGALVAPVGYYVGVEALRIGGLLLLVSLAYPLLHEEGGERCMLVSLAVAGLACALLALGQRAEWFPGLFPTFPHYDQRMYSVFGNQGLLGGYLAVALVATIPLIHDASSRARRWYVLVALVLLVTLLLSLSRIAVVAVVAGYGVLVVLRESPRRGIPLLVGAGMVVGLGCLWILGEAGIARWAGSLGEGDVGGQIRPWIWAATVDVIRSHPWRGIGLGNLVYGLPVYLGAHPAPAAVVPMVTQTTYHAHGDLLEFIAECGLAGLGLLIWVGARIRLKNGRALACLSALVVFSCAHPAWSSTPHALAGLLCLALIMKPPAVEGKPMGVIFHRIIGAGAVLGAAVYCAGVFYPSALLRKAEDLHIAGKPALATYARAVAVPWASPEARESMGIACLEAGDYRMARALFGQASRGIDTGRIHLLLAMTAEAQRDTGAACDHFRACLRRWPHSAPAERGVALHCAE